MPPRQKPSSTSKRAKDDAENTDEDAIPETEKADEGPKADVNPDKKEEPTSEPPSKKRKTLSKAGAANASQTKRSTRSSVKTESSHEPKAIIKFLLSDEAFKLLDQLPGVDADGFQYPRDRLNPFQDLVAACMVSKPFSHRVATRAINDLFAEKNSLTSPQEVLDFGHDKVLESLHRSKTLHKDKTTSQIIGIAEVCQYAFDGDSSLSSLRDQASRSPEEERALIVKSFKGYGPKTVDIFFRRVQVEWEEVYPFADDATLKAARGVGLDVNDADGLRELVDDVVGDKDDKEKRLAYARVVDVLVYLGLENKMSEVEANIEKKDE